MAIQRHEFTVSKIYIHASYNQPKFANDIAIIELDKATDDEINDAACMPEPVAQHDSKSTTAVVKRANSALKYAKSEIISADECSSFFNQQSTSLTPGQFCANVHTNDSQFSAFIGAIMFESDQSRQYTLRGFTSTAVRSGQAFDESKPYVFTDLAHHLNWIRTAIGDELRRKPESSNIAVDPALSSLRACQLKKGDGYCVKYHQCSSLRDAPGQSAALDEKKCFTEVDASQNIVNEDGVCCPAQYIELNYNEEFDLDQRFQGKRGVELLNTKKCGQVDPSRRIVGGSKADLKEFPWIGLIKYKYGRIFKFTCGSSLISDKYLLTCAHCITNLPTGYEIVGVRMGEYDRTTDPDCKAIDEDQNECNPPVDDISVAKLIPHPKYNTPRYANDVGLIRLSKAPDASQGEH